MRKYVSPMVRARAIVSGQEKTVSSKARQVAERMVRLLPMLVLDLERQDAPQHVFRWVAWGANATIQRRRADLVLLLRRSIARRLNGWFEERHFSAAMAVLERARDEARKRGGIMPGADEVPLDAYRAAVEGATKNKRARTLEPELEAAIEEDEPSSPDGETDPENDDEEEGAEVGEGGGAPISERMPVGRARILRRLSDAVCEALALDDVEAAQAISVTISRLCRPREAVEGPEDLAVEPHDGVEPRRQRLPAQ